MERIEASVVFQPSLRFAVLPKRFWLVSLALLVVMNGADACLTLAWVVSGHATEANPVMEALLHNGPAMFMVVKMALVAAGVMTLRRLRHHWLAQYGMIASLLVYAMIMGHHLGYIVELVTPIEPSEMLARLP